MDIELIIRTHAYKEDWNEGAVTFFMCSKCEKVVLETEGGDKLSLGELNMAAREHIKECNDETIHNNC